MGDVADAGKRLVTLHPACPLWLRSVVAQAIQHHDDVATGRRGETVVVFSKQ